MPIPRPLPPEILASALHDRIHPTSGRLLAAKRIWRAGFTRRVATAEALMSGSQQDEPTPECDERIAPTRGRR